MSGFRRRLGGLVDDHRAHRRDRERVSVRAGSLYLHRADCADGAADILDDDGLAEIAAQLVGSQAADDVGAAAGGEGHDYLDRPRGPGLGRRLR